jgi:flagellar hook assembly protein FlgD
MTTIEFHLAADARVNITIYDAAGRTVRRLVQDGFYAAGINQAVWDGMSDVGAKAASGVYFYRLDADGETFTSKMVLLR